MKRTFTAVYCFAFVACAVGLRANGSRLPSQDAAAVARGYADTAGIDSPAAVYYNPAGLVDVRGSQVFAGLYVISPSTSFDPASGQPRVQEQSSTFYQPHLFASLPLGANGALGFGLYSPFGQSTKWPSNSGFAGIATFNEVKYVTSSVAGSYRFAPNFSVGASLQYSRASVNLNRLTPLAPGVVSSFGFNGHGYAPSANFGIKWSPAPHHTFGVFYQRKTDFQFTGTAALQGVLSNSGKVGWVFPDNFAIGWQWSVTPKWITEIDYDLTRWSRVGTLHLNAGPLSTAVPLNWQNSAYYSAGVTRHLTKSVDISAGYQFSENSIPDSSFNPALPDVNRHLLNAGIIWRSGRYGFSAVFQRGISPSHTVTGFRPDGLGGSAAGTYHNSFWAADITTFMSF